MAADSGMPYLALIGLIGIVAVVGAVVVYMMRKGEQEAATETPVARQVTRHHKMCCKPSTLRCLTLQIPARLFPKR